MTNKPHRLLALAALMWMPLAGCSGGTDEHADHGEEGHVHTDDEQGGDHTEPAGGPMGLDIGEGVRENLGLTFATAEPRPVRRTVRVPGEFELRPDAQREYRATLPGRVELLVTQYQRVTEGQPLARIDSPQWAQLRHEVVEAEGEIRLAEAAIAVAQAAHTEALQRIAFLEKRNEELKRAGSRQVTLEGELDQMRNALPRLEAELNAARVDLEEAHEHFDSRLNVMASLIGMPVDRLTAANGSGQPAWRSKLLIEVTAASVGIVDQLPITQGGWVDAGGLVLSTTDPTRLRFHAHAPQTDIARFRDGQSAFVVAPIGGSIAGDQQVPGTLNLGFRAHPEQRTIPVYINHDADNASPGWARPGVTAFLEIVVDGDEASRLAIPVQAVVEDGLDRVVFRRMPDHPGLAQKRKVRLGVSDGRYVEVIEGVNAGDQVVVNGAYTLKLASATESRSAPAGYHYHADGSLHKDH